MSDEIVSQSDNALTIRTGDQLIAQYLHRIRMETRFNANLRESLASTGSIPEIKPRVLEAMSSSIIEGTEKEMEAAVDIILKELESQRLAPPSAYLVDPESGRAIMPVTRDMTFMPSGWTDDDGKYHKPSGPVLHPGISSNLAMAKHDGAKKAELLKKAESDPSVRHALAHITQPRLTIDMASERLLRAGIRTVTGPIEGKTEIMEFGSENPQGEFQSMNPSFHRAATHAAVIAIKVAKLMGGSGAVTFGEIVEHSTSKKRWNTLEITLAPDLPTA